MNRSIFSLFVISLFSIFITSCNPDQPDGLLDVVWRVNSISTHPSEETHVSIEIRNNMKEEMTHQNWALHFNQISGPVLKVHSPQGIEIRNDNGDYFTLQPTNDFQSLPPGKTITIKYDISGIVDKWSEVPKGLFLVKDNNPRDVNFEVIKLDEKILEDVNPSTSSTRYHENRRLSLIDPDELLPLIPRPEEYTYLNEKKILGAVISYVASDELDNEIDLFKGDLMKIGKTLVEKDNAPDITLALITGSNSEESSYRLRIDQTGINITAASKSGIFYGIQTLLQMIRYAHDENETQIELPGIEISDKARFGYRGIHLDVSRNFHSKEKVLDILDLLAHFKVNKFHFHLTDDEGWRLEIPGLPELTEIGSKRGFTIDESDHLIPSYGSGYDPDLSYGSGYYSRQDFIDILKYADDRHIEVITEIDMPGHARAAIISMKNRYERLLSEGDTPAALEYRLHDPDDRSEYRSAQNWKDNVVCICQEGAFNFMDKVFSELIQMYEEAQAPLTAIHVGGDEQPYGAWQRSPLCQQYIKENGMDSYADLPSDFFQRMTKTLGTYDLITAGWEEMAIAHTSEGHESTEIDASLLDENLRLYVWNAIIGGGRDDMIYKLANAGFPVVMSNSSSYYFDMAYDKDPDEIGLSWSGYSNTEKIFETEPLNIFIQKSGDPSKSSLSEDYLKQRVALTQKGRENFLGIQAQLWSETVRNEEAIDYLMFPKLLAFAHRSWSQEPDWARSGAPENIERQYLEDWNRFANTLGQKAIPMIEKLDYEIVYRIPEPGAIIEDGILRANSAFPGMRIKYMLKGSNQEREYMGPVSIQKGADVILWCEGQDGRKGRTTKVY